MKLVRYFAGTASKKILTFVLIAGTGFAYGCASGSSEQKKAAAAIVLTDKQLDTATAGAGTISLDLTASALGLTVTTSTEGFVRAARSSILTIAIDPRAPDTTARARLLGAIPADFVFAAGQALAMGDSNAQCAAALNTTLVDLAFILQLNRANVTPTSAICSCAAFVITRVH